MKFKSVYFFLFLPLVVFPFWLKAQTTIAQPDILNFYYDQINAGSQTWAIDQDKTGIMYFANNSGLLTFNGKEWKLFPLPNKTIVRALSVGNNSKIFVGGQDALGYFIPENNGTLVYHSLVEKLPSKFHRFGDVWNIVQKDNIIYFRTGSTIFAYNNAKDKFENYQALTSSSWSYMEICNGQLFAQNSSEGLVRWVKNKKQLIATSIFKFAPISSIIALDKESFLIFTVQKGAFLLTDSTIKEFSIDKQLIASQIYTGISLNNEQIALGTVSNGIYIIDRNGKIIRNFSSDIGLQNNSILALYLDKNKALWTALDEGISLIDYASPIQKISGFSKTAVPTYTSIIYQNNLYIGTSDGTYTSPLISNSNEDITLSQASFFKIPHSNRQVWSFFNYNGNLLMGHHNGIFHIKDKAQLIGDNHEGAWLFRKIPNSKNLIIGTYSGIQLLVKDKGKFVLKKLPQNNVNEPLRFIEIDSIHHIVWASHPYRGIYKFQMDNKFENIQKTELLTHKNGLPNELNNFVFKINNKIVFTTQNGVYDYDYSKNTFYQSASFSSIFGNEMIKFLVSDQKNRIWFATEKEVGVVDNNKKIYINELEGKLIAGFENIYPYNDKNIFFPAHKGLIHLNFERYRQGSSNINVLMSKVISFGKTDSILYNGFLTTAKQSNNILPANFNSFHFDYATDRYNQTNQIYYSYQLSGYDDHWSNWSKNTSKDYTNLSFGKYTFSIKAKDNLGNISTINSYSFEILPRWYQTKLALFVYILTFFYLISLALRFHRRRLKKQKETFLSKQVHLKYVHDLEIGKNEAEIVRLKNEYLETEMMYKNKELASTTMHLFNRGRLLEKIRNELNILMINSSQKEEKTNLNKLLRLISQEEKQQNNWEQFSIHFDEVHNRFLHKLKTDYPDLTPGDLKLCAYLKMNLSSKEIAQLLHLSLKGVENGRYRLRKKLNLGANDSLTNFILNFN